MITLEPDVSSPDLIDPTFVYMSGADDLNVFVTEYIDNVNYDDSDLYPYDGYVLYTRASVVDQRPAGVCVD